MDRAWLICEIIWMSSPSHSDGIREAQTWRKSLTNIGTQCVQSQWRFIPQYGEIYEDNLLISHHCSADCAPPPPPRQLAVHVTCLRLSKKSTYSVIIKHGNEQRDYVTVNYSVTLKLRLKQIKLFISLFFKDNISQHVYFLHFLCIQVLQA